MYRKEKHTFPIAASSGTSEMDMGKTKSLLPSPSVTRRPATYFRRKRRQGYLLRSVFVLLSMAFSFLVFSPRSPLYANDDNHSPHAAHRRLLQTESDEGSGDTSPATNLPQKNIT